MKNDLAVWQPARQVDQSDRLNGSGRSSAAVRLIWRGVCVLAVALVMGHAAESLGQAIPDLTVSQVQGVNESEFFYLGPTGMRGWIYWSSLTSASRQILVTQVPAGSPAEVAGMQYHDVILGIGSANFTSDARVAFVDAITAAEAGDGQLHLKVYRPSTGVTDTKTIQLGITNAPLAATTPYNCDKALAILTNYCEYVYNRGNPDSEPTRELSLWAMLNSGIPKYVDWAKAWIKAQPYASRTNLSIYRPSISRNWDMSYALATLAQYYLLTVAEGAADADVLEPIANLALYIAMGQDRRGQWGHTYAFPANNGGQLHGTLPGYGSLNNAGLVSLYGLVLARKCGIPQNDEIDAAIEKSAAFFRANVGIGTINYGFHEPIDSVTDVNGRMGIAAVAFRALGDAEAAKWFAMMTSTYGWRDWGHTGNEFNHAWGPLGANVGGPALVSFVQTNRQASGNSPYYQVSLTMRRQPAGWFRSQGQAGRGTGRNNGHATGAYALQLGIPNRSIDVTGAGYDTNLFWLSSEEMDALRIGFQYESSGATVDHLSTADLFSHLSNFAPKVANKMADELRNRLENAYGGSTVRAELIGIVENASQADTRRVAALRALDTDGRTAVKATVDNWYAPANSYVLNYGAASYGVRDKASILKILQAIAAFDRAKPFDMLVAGNYSQKIYTMSTNGFSEAEMDIYFAAVEVILSPDAGDVSWFVNNQGIRNWAPHVLARYADSILRVSETLAMSYSAPDILTQPPIGEGMYSWMVRSGYTAYNQQLDTGAHWRRYGQNALIYTNFMRRLKAQDFTYDHYVHVDAALQLHLPASNPALYWFRDLIADNVASVSTLEALRDLMDANPDKDLFRAVVLDEIAKHASNSSPFEDIVKYVGFRSPIVGTNWRLFRGAVELGTNTVYSTDQAWLDALPVAATSNDHVRVGGILHVLAGREVAAAKALAEDFLIHDNDFVTIAALDVYRAVGEAGDLVMLFNQFMTNVATVVEGEFTFADDFKIHAYWDAIHAIVERHGPISSTIANQIASAFNTRTSSGTDMSGIAIVARPRAEPMSVLNPVGSNVDKIYGQYMTGPIGILGLFPGTDCDQALQNVVNNIGDVQYWGRGHKYAASEGFMRQKTHAELVALHNSGADPRWNTRAVTLYLIMEYLQGSVPLAHHLDLLTVRNVNNTMQRDSSGYFWKTYQYELNRRRGLEEQDGVHFFYVK